MPNGFTCAARRGKTDPPQDCDWPFCGCDPYADKVIAHLQEIGMLRPIELEAQRAVAKKPGREALVEEVTLELWQAICELPDRGSPEDDPDAAVLSLAELRRVVDSVLGDRLSSSASQEAPTQATLTKGGA